MDLTTIIAAGVTAVGGYGLGWLSRPAAQTKADEVKLKREQQRKVLADARMMVAEANQKGLPKHGLASDPRLLAISSRLDGDVRKAYQPLPVPTFSNPRGTETHALLTKNLDKLEKKWKLL